MKQRVEWGVSKLKNTQKLGEVHSSLPQKSTGGSNAADALMSDFCLPELEELISVVSVTSLQWWQQEINPARLVYSTGECPAI